MANNVGLQFAKQSDTGLVRPHNEDAVAISDAYGFAILADGMGGYNAGEVASGMAITILKPLLEAGMEKLQRPSSDLLFNRSKQIQQLLLDSIRHTNTAILDMARSDPQYQGMGTTLVVALFDHDRVIIAHVGDSRAYRLRQGEMVQVTRDHSLLQEQIDAGMVAPDLARFSLNKNLITRAVGVDDETEVEIHEYLTEMGDLYLLCSDGLSDMLELDEMRRVLQNDDIALEASCDVLVQTANYYGGRDNISVVLVRVQSVGKPVVGLWNRIAKWMNQAIRKQTQEEKRKVSWMRNAGRPNNVTT